MKRAFITGASSGIGEALARELSLRGWSLGLMARRGDLLRKLASELRESAWFEGDVSDLAAVRAAVAHCSTSLGGPFDLAIANAGISVPTWATRFKVEDAVRIMRVNVEGMFNLFDATVPSMVERGSGHFAGVASIAGLRGLPSASVYSASKAAMQTFLDASRVELARSGVAVTTVNPGWVETPIIAKYKGRVPFVMSAAKAAVIIADGLERRARIIEFPFPMSMAMRLARLLPASVYDVVLRPYSSRKIDESKVRR